MNSINFETLKNLPLIGRIDQHCAFQQSFCIRKMELTSPDTMGIVEK